eukprot:CAMPEP_0180356770 /NCGR_PEP_ID=MMETSP0989-20121125/9531_1 /TAXON_ID=697907 /ORGANISM="non described non described, Strain CCMP2293" /LENGTH=74 /DNA_ID=CAMNT_0022346885 /DNA_START=547 /DNA_END=767 /DNA_ORIENTATION=-
MGWICLGLVGLFPGGCQSSPSDSLQQSLDDASPEWCSACSSSGSGDRVSDLGSVRVPPILSAETTRLARPRTAA